MALMNYGTVEGTGAALNITVGFIPDVVWLMNVDGNCMMVWTANLGDADGQKIVDSGSGATDISTVTSGGVTAGDYDNSFLGFSISTDSDINAAGETINWVAWAK